MKISKIRDNNVFVSFISLLKVKHTPEFSNRRFNEHPHKYNLFGISNLLSDYGIANAGTKIQDKEKDLPNIELPFIAHTGSDFVVVYKIEQDQVHYWWNGKKISLSVAQFIESWSGIVLLTETTPHSIEPDYKEHKKQELFNFGQKILLSAAAGLILLFAYIQNELFQNLGANLLLLLNLAGIYIGYLLVLKQMNVQSKYADKICSLFSQSDCNNVLESDAAKLWGVFGWSEIGLGYFAANGLLILFLPSWIPFLAILNLFTLPYSFWSVWYQKFKAKQWCPLCLMVQALLWGIFVVNLLFGFIRIPDWNWSNCLIWVAIASTYGVCMLTLNLLIPKLSENTKIEQLNQEINSIKANEDVFSALLKQQPRYEVNPSDSQIVFGNPEARLQITILTNPFCNPCASMHRRVENFLQETQGRVCIRYIFASFHPRRDFASKGLIAAYLQKERNKFEHIIADWFQEGKLLKEAFFNDLQLDMTDPAIEAELQKHEAWRAKTQLRATPTIIINGYQLPGNYKIEDLRYFIELEIDIDQSQAR